MLVSGRVSSKIPQQNFDSLQEVERERMKELTGRYCKPCHLHSHETLFVGKEWVDSSWLAACDLTFWQPKDLCKLCLWFTSIKVGERIPTKFITRPQNTLITNHPSSSMNPRARNGDQWWFATCWGSLGLPQLPRKETEKVKEKRLSPSKVGLLGRVKWLMLHPDLFGSAFEGISTFFREASKSWFPILSEVDNPPIALIRWCKQLKKRICSDDWKNPWNQSLSSICIVGFPSQTLSRCFQEVWKYEVTRNSRKSS